jgi:hypothetical protein
MDSSQPDRELQQVLERFTTQFIDRIRQATDALQRSPTARVRDEALRKNLLYASSALEIASGPAPEVGLLDMMVFIHLSRAVLETHWIPQLYGELGRELSEVFARSEEELAQVAAEVLSEEQRRQLTQIVDTWLAENPDQVRVEGIRLSDFAATAGAAAAERAIQTRGLLSSVKTATEAANQALVLSERAFFLVHRLPFIWQLQVRVGARQLLNDIVTRLTEGPDALLVQLTRQSRRLARGVVLTFGAVGATAFLFWSLGRLIRKSS